MLDGIHYRTEYICNFVVVCVYVCAHACVCVHMRVRARVCACVCVCMCNLLWYTEGYFVMSYYICVCHNIVSVIPPCLLPPAADDLI